MSEETGCCRFFVVHWQEISVCGLSASVLGVLGSELDSDRR